MAIRPGAGTGMTPAQIQQMRAQGTVVDQYNPGVAGPQYARTPGTGTNRSGLIPASVGGFTTTAPRYLGPGGNPFSRGQHVAVQTPPRYTMGPEQQMTTVSPGGQVQGPMDGYRQPGTALQSGQMQQGVVQSPGTPIPGQTALQSGQPINQPLAPHRQEAVDWMRQMLTNYDAGTLRPDQIQSIQENQLRHDWLPQDVRAGIEAMVPQGTAGQQWIQSMIDQYNQGTLRRDQVQALQINQANNPNLTPEQRAAIQAMTLPEPSGRNSPVPAGLRGSEEALRQGLSGALASVQGATDRARGDVENYLGQATGTLDPFYQSGNQASQLQAALSGALGPEAQQQAFDNYMESPEQAYLRERGEQAILRNASATGGLGGGRVLQELQRHGIGLAAQDYANSFGRLGALADRGLTSGADIARALLTSGGALADMEMGAGLTSGDYRYRTGDSTAAGRTRAGEQIAGSTQDTVSNLADVLFRSGLAGGEQYDQLTSNLANLLAGQGTAQLTADQQLAAMLANIATGQGTQLAGMPGIPGAQQTGSSLGEFGQLAGGLGGLITAGAQAGLFSDRRLKTNIRRIGQTPGGHSLYTWDWTAEGARIAGNQPTIGVIAQEVPEAAFMGPDGYLRVDYTRVT